MTPIINTPAAKLLRLSIAFAGGYVFTAALIACMTTLLPWLGMAKTEAASLSSLVGLLAYVLIMICLLVSQQPMRLWLNLAALVVIMLLSAWLLTTEVR